MGSTEIINRTTKALDMKVSNCRYFIKLTTVDKNQSYIAHADLTDTYMEYSLGADGAGKPVIVNSDECVDNKTIIISEVDGNFKVKLEPRVTTPTRKYSLISSISREKPKKRPRSFWRLWIFKTDGKF